MSSHRHIYCARCRQAAVLLLGVVLSPPLLAQMPSSSAGEAVVSVATIRSDTLIRLPHKFIIGNSDSVWLAGQRPLVRGVDYSIDLRGGTVSFRQEFLSSAGTPTDSVHVVYRYLPFQFRDSYARRTLVVVPDTLTRDTLRVARPEESLSVEDLFGPNLQKSGSIVRGFSVGSGRDVSPTSGLRLQMSGKIASDIDIAAALTDENTPIQPEGTTQSLQEFDKVFVTIATSDLGATLGDFNLDVPGGEFGRLFRKLQGAQGTAKYRLGNTNGSALVSGAVTRGKFTTNQFNGTESVQGPYRLTGKNGESLITVIAGTERVYIDGQLQTRGDVNDYVIDYSLGEITFTTRRPITSASRVVVDFEYSDRQYARSLLGGLMTQNFFNNNASLSVSYFREADDPDSPIDASLPDSARQIIAAAGANQGQAAVSGVTRVDSNGLYMQIDTVLADGSPYRLYRYAPGNPGALYLVTFSYAGAGKGDYVRQQLGVFVWTGVGTGDYLPVQYLPIPQSHQVLDASLKATPLSDLTIGAEYAHSVLDRNRLSTLDDDTKDGNAVHLTAVYKPEKILLGGTNIGGMEVRLKERYVQDRFAALDRTNEIEFNRKWGLDSVRQESEEIREGLLKYYPDAGLVVGGGYGSITRGEDFSSARWEGLASMQGGDRPVGTYAIERIRSEDRISDIASAWLRQKGSLEYTWGKFTPGIGYEAEDRRMNSILTGALNGSSFAFTQYSGGIRVRDIGPLSLGAELGVRDEERALGGEVVPEASSFTQSYVARVTQWNDFTASLDVVLRNRNVTPEFEQTGASDATTILLRDQMRYTPFNRGVEADVYYEGSSERSARLQRVFVRVTPGTGNYRYLGDLNSNGVADESEFEQVRFNGDYAAVTVPTSQLFPVINLRTSGRLRLTPSRFISARENFVERAIAAISTETYVRIDEKSATENESDVYLLRLSTFQNDSTTITGSTIFTQDVYLFETARDFSVRLRYSNRNGMNNLSSGIERGYGNERSVRLRWQLVPEISNQLDLVARADRLIGPAGSPRNRDIRGSSLGFDLSYRPVQQIEYGLNIQVGRSLDVFPDPDLSADLNTEATRFVYAFEGSGQLRLLLSREEVLFNRSSTTFAYELTGGRQPGVTWIWGAALDYRVTSFIQATVNYDGRSLGGSSPIHAGRAEVRAFF